MEVWLNRITTRCSSVAYKNVAIPVGWEVVSHKGNATAFEHKAIIKQFVAELGAHRIGRVYADREFGSDELFAYLMENQIDFHIRLKTSHKSGGKSFLQIFRNQAEKVNKKLICVFKFKDYLLGVRFF